MPDINNLEFYNGLHTGQQIDEAVDRALSPRTSNPVGSDSDFTDSALASVAAVTISLNQEIVQVIVSMNDIDGQAAYGWTFSNISPGRPTDIYIEENHVPIMVEFSNPSVICGDYSITVSHNLIEFRGAGCGSTDMTITLAKRIGAIKDGR